MQSMNTKNMYQPTETSHVFGRVLIKVASKYSTVWHLIPLILLTDNDQYKVALGTYSTTHCFHPTDKFVMFYK
jgi:hypothetical protein